MTKIDAGLPGAIIEQIRANGYQHPPADVLASMTPLEMMRVATLVSSMWSGANPYSCELPEFMSGYLTQLFNDYRDLSLKADGTLDKAEHLAGNTHQIERRLIATMAVVQAAKMLKIADDQGCGWEFNEGAAA